MARFLRDIDRGLIWGSLDAPLGYRTRDDHHDHPAPILHAGYVRGFSVHRTARPGICARFFVFVLVILDVRLIRTRMLIYPPIKKSPIYILIQFNFPVITKYPHRPPSPRE